MEKDLKAHLQRFRLVWDTSLRFGVQSALVWGQVPVHRPVVLAMPRAAAGWCYRCMDPRLLRHLVCAEDFHEAARQIIRDDAPWYVWANDTHTTRYVQQDLADAWKRTWVRGRNDVLHIHREIAEIDAKISEILTQCG